MTWQINEKVEKNSLKLLVQVESFPFIVNYGSQS